MKWLITALALLTLSAPGCLIVGAAGGLTMTPIPDEYEGPIPDPFTGSEPPALEPTRHAGLKKAPSLGPDVYYDEPTELWYRYEFRRWYQAFRWNGNWFVLQETPEALASVEISPEQPLPTLPEYEEPPSPAR
jgi:hypothetical protein